MFLLTLEHPGACTLSICNMIFVVVVYEMEVRESCH